ncbi:MAG: peptidase [Symploca sp. SIO1B1]|nr:peptidase [Symploca sp. SIO2D2]NER24867.1 peptidase [Symploca sp. SIO1C2]NER47800.1 peptidase [Symploca sp. SIO1A3]NER96762.1 peptidase [Symploca sp. SIO1B1]
MNNAFASRFHLALLFGASFLMMNLTATAARGQEHELYRPIQIPDSKEISDILSDKDIPTGDGGFARDYTVQLKEGDQVSVDLISDNFDTIITLMASDGSKVAENDDGPDGTTNSLLFYRISETGKYIIRVRAFGETGGGNFKLKVTRLKPID